MTDYDHLDDLSHLAKELRRLQNVTTNKIASSETTLQNIRKALQTRVGSAAIATRSNTTRAHKQQPVLANPQLMKNIKLASNRRDLDLSKDKTQQKYEGQIGIEKLVVEKD